MNLREQYESETGLPAEYNLGFARGGYVAWLERRAACAEKLAEVLRQGDGDSWFSEAKNHVLDEYEAAKKGG